MYRLAYGDWVGNCYILNWLGQSAIVAVDFQRDISCPFDLVAPCGHVRPTEAQ
jgi:hypothetical protein